MTAIIPHPTTGEAIDLATATDEQIVAAVESAERIVTDLRSLRETAAVELTRRLDKSGSWTRRVEVDGIVYEIKASSPTAGTESYPADELAPVLLALIEDDVIDGDAASAALEYVVTVKLTATSKSEADEIVAQARADARVASVDAIPKVKKSGITALTKIPGAAERVEAVKRVDEPAPAERRPAKVSVKS